MPWDVKQADGGVCKIVQPASFNLGGIANKFTGSGVLLALYKKYADGLPYRKEAGQASKGLIAGGLLGILDPPPMQTPAYNPSLNVQVRSSIYD
jgi:hypothetical protein